MLRSILAVAAGIGIWGVLWVSANLGLSAAAPARFDPNGIPTDAAFLVIFIVVCAVLCLVAGWLCAAIARKSPMKHVWTLALIQLAIGIAVQSGVWELMPVWYHLTFLAIVVPMHLAGGRMRALDAEAVPSSGRPLAEVSP